MKFNRYTGPTAIVAAGAVLFAVQILGQAAFLTNDAVRQHSTILQAGWQQASHTPWFIAEILGFVLLGIVLHALIVAIPVIISGDIARALGLGVWRQRFWRAVIIVLFGLLLLMWNQALFPFSDVIPNFFLNSIWPLAILSAGFLALVGVWLWSRPGRLTLIVVLLLCGALFVPDIVPATHTTAKHSGQPNVILIGLDSVRPDHVFCKHSDCQTLAPHVARWAAGAINYTNAITPMARTLPALTSLLTAKYPKHNHARINLTPADRIDLRWTLAKVLKRRGYHTVFAVDGAEFVNISKAYGFDRLATPQQGLPDYVFSTLLDSVGTNLLGLFPLDRWLNPVCYANEGADAAYRPAQFDHVLS